MQNKLYEDAKRRAEKRLAEKEKAIKEFESKRSTSRVKSPGKFPLDRLLSNGSQRKKSIQDPLNPALYTFKPSINKHSKNLLKKARSYSNNNEENDISGTLDKSKNTDIYSRRIQEQMVTEKLADTIREHNKEKELDECTFKPKINAAKKNKSQNTLELSQKTFKTYLRNATKSEMTSPSNATPKIKDGLKKHLNSKGKFI